jgi:hypothetical protein
LVEPHVAPFATKSRVGCNVFDKRKRPPGLRTRKTSCNVRARSGTEQRTRVLMTASILLSSASIRSALPLRRSIFKPSRSASFGDTDT